LGLLLGALGHVTHRLFLLYRRAPAAPPQGRPRERNRPNRFPFGEAAGSEAGQAHRVDRRTVLPDLEVHVATGDQPGGPGVADGVALRDVLALAHREPGHVVVHGHIGAATDDSVVDHHLVAVGAVGCGVDLRDGSPGRGALGLATRRVQVDAVVHVPAADGVVAHAPV